MPLREIRSNSCRIVVHDRVGNAVGVAEGGALPGQPLQLLHRRLAALVLDRVLVAELVEAELAAVDDFANALDRVRVLAEQPVHLRRRLQVPLARREPMEAQLLNGAFEADSGDDVVQRPALGRVVVHVVRGNQAYAGLRREGVEGVESSCVVAPEEHGAGEIAAARV